MLRSSQRANGQSSSQYNPGAMMSQTLTSTLPHPLNPLPPQPTSASTSTSPSYSTKVTCAESRVDPAGSSYTAYIISVVGPSGSALIEHRFSEFHRLHLDVKANGVDLPHPFPPKSLSGRLGNWTPSALLAPTQQRKLVDGRVVALDRWLLGLVEAVEGGGVEGNVTLREDIIEFLEVRAAAKLPCR